MRTLNRKPAVGLVWQRSSFSTTEALVNGMNYPQSATSARNAANARDSGNARDTRGCLQLTAERGALLLRESEEPETVLTTRRVRVAALLFAIKAGGWRDRRRG